MRSMLRASKVTGWVLLALLTLQTACGSALSGAEVRASLPRASAGFNLFSPEQDIQLGEASAAQQLGAGLEQRKRRLPAALLARRRDAGQVDIATPR